MQTHRAPWGRGDGDADYVDRMADEPDQRWDEPRGLDPLQVDVGDPTIRPDLELEGGAGCGLVEGLEVGIDAGLLPGTGRAADREGLPAMSSLAQPTSARFFPEWSTLHASFRSTPRTSGAGISTSPATYQRVSFHRAKASS